jgi:hypothetical protein
MNEEDKNKHKTCVLFNTITAIGGFYQAAAEEAGVWATAPCFGVIYSRHFFRNVGKKLFNHTTLQSRRTVLSVKK